MLVWTLSQHLYPLFVYVGGEAVNVLSNMYIFADLHVHEPFVLLLCDNYQTFMCWSMIENRTREKLFIVIVFY